MTKYELILRNADTGEFMKFDTNGFCDLYKQCKEYIRLICNYNKEYKLPRLKPEVLLDTLFRDKFLQYRELTIKIEPLPKFGVMA